MADREKDSAIAEVLQFLEANDLTLEDLLDYGGEDLEAMDNRNDREKFKLVERAFSIMNRHGLTIEDLEEQG